MISHKINVSRLRRSIQELSEVGRQSGGGISRFTLDHADLKAREYVTNLMKDSGLTVQVDQFANIIGRMSGASHDLPVVMCGSHIDTVPNGGSLDGAYGVLSGIEAARTIHDLAIPIRNPLEVTVFTEEEGYRFPAFIGSLGMTGVLSREAAYSLKDADGVSFGKALADAGLYPARLRARRMSPTEVKAYVELHIEQGPVLDSERIPIGVVKSIVGVGRLKVLLEGCAGHTGTTPMLMRRDALLGASRLVLRTNEIALREGRGIATVGSLTVSPNVANIIPGQVALTVDFRHPTKSGLARLRNDLVSEVKRVGKMTHLNVKVEERSFAKPSRMSRRLIDSIASNTRSLGLRYKKMNSGAGHDCQNMARITSAGMIFVPSIAGLSHVPGESTSSEDLEAGANVLLNTLLQLLGGERV